MKHRCISALLDSIDSARILSIRLTELKCWLHLFKQFSIYLSIFMSLSNTHSSFRAPSVALDLLRDEDRSSWDKHRKASFPRTLLPFGPDCHNRASNPRSPSHHWRTCFPISSCFDTDQFVQRQPIRVQLAEWNVLIGHRGGAQVFEYSTLVPTGDFSYC